MGNRHASPTEAGGMCYLAEKKNTTKTAITRQYGNVPPPPPKTKGAPPSGGGGGGAAWGGGGGGGG